MNHQDDAGECCQEQFRKLTSMVREYNYLLDQANDAVVIIRDGAICLSNLAFRELLGFADNHSGDGQFHDHVHPDEREKFLMISEWRMCGVETLDIYPTVLTHINGKSVDVEISAKRIDFRGRPAELLIIRDITERKTIENTLESARIRNEQLLSAIASVLIGLDSVGRVTHWNGAAENVFGIKAPDAIGKNFYTLDIEWDWRELEQCISGSIGDRKDISLHDFTFRKGEDHHGVLDITITPFPEADSDRCGGLILAEDITARKILESQLREAQKLESLGHLSAGIAHELNTPTQFVGDNVRFLAENFTDIITCITLHGKLMNALKDENVHCDLCDEIVTAHEKIDIDFLLEEIPMAISESLGGLERIAAIVQSMKEFARPGADGRSYMDINRAITNAVTISRNEWKYVAELETRFAEDLPRVSCYESEINLVLLNIIINAAHAIANVRSTGTELAGRIMIETSAEQSSVVIAVHDNGTGIPAAYQNRIFDPFFTTKEVGQGTGQGLAVAYSVMKKHTGSIRFETEEGKGTTFYLQLPVNA